MASQELIYDCQRASNGKTQIVKLSSNYILLYAYDMDIAIDILSILYLFIIHFIQSL
jgi:hypothetical protein